MRKLQFFIVFLLLLLVPQFARPENDSVRTYVEKERIVTAERSSNRLSESTFSVSSLLREDYSTLPVVSVSDLLMLRGGIVFVHRDGLQKDPIPIVRGFYGGGEAEYLLVQKNGFPVNNGENGLVDWNLLTLDEVENAEIIRGGSSALYGDAAMGGTITLRGPVRSQHSADLTVSFGGYGETSLGASTAGAFAPEVYYRLSAARNTSRGFREHSDQRNEHASFSTLLQPASFGLTTAEVYLSSRVTKQPGALSTSELSAGRGKSSPFYKFDEANEKRSSLRLTNEYPLSTSLTMETAFLTELRSRLETKTLVLAPKSYFGGFADTKDRDLDALRLNGRVVLSADSLVGERDRATGGVELARDNISSRYLARISGDFGHYDSARSTPSSPTNESVDISRLTSSFFVQYEYWLADSLRLVASMRFDQLNDAFTPQAGSRKSPTHTGFSPKLGLNLPVVSSEVNSLHAYATYCQFFKAPTLDQLSDVRVIPFPPYGITLSNSTLKPQEGTSTEFGLYQRGESADLSYRATVSAYRILMRDEIDFDLQTLRYINIGRSEHRGAEVEVSSMYLNRYEVFATYMYQQALARSGQNQGRQLKAIPLHSWTAGISGRITSGAGVSLTAHSVGKAFADDENMLPLDGYTILDARISYSFRAISLGFDIINVLDKKYVTTGYKDPAGSNEIFVYPSAGRTGRLQLEVSL